MSNMYSLFKAYQKFVINEAEEEAQDSESANEKNYDYLIDDAKATVITDAMNNLSSVVAKIIKEMGMTEDTKKEVNDSLDALKAALNILKGSKVKPRPTDETDVPEVETEI